MNKVDDYLRSYGVDIRPPERSVARSPRAPKHPRRPLWLTTMVRKLRRMV